MKALFKSKFPFVELPDEELTNEQLSIKRQYEKAYQLYEKVTSEKADKVNRLRKVHGNAGRTGKRGNRAGNDSGYSDALLQGADKETLDRLYYGVHGTSDETSSLQTESETRLS